MEGIDFCVKILVFVKRGRGVQIVSKCAYAICGWSLIKNYEWNIVRNMPIINFCIHSIESEINSWANLRWTAGLDIGRLTLIWFLGVSKVKSFSQRSIPIFVCLLVKFRYSEKAMYFCEISTVDLSYLVTVKSLMEISQSFGTISEYMNFMERVNPPFY